VAPPATCSINRDFRRAARRRQQHIRPHLERLRGASTPIEPLIARESAVHAHREPENSGICGHRLAQTAPARHNFAMWTTVEMWNTRERARP